MEETKMKKTLVAVAVATGVLGAAAHDVVQIRKETGMSVTKSAKELANRTKKAFVSGVCRGYLLSSR